MKLKEVIQMMKMYASCPVCGEENVGEENGEIEIDTKRGYFKRSCACGWRVEVKEGMSAWPTEK
ncbi:MAG: DUF3797 domain-containing protein [Oscillospiraceae bacterium]|nr:DUF3797 domain-containing protein [Oscillospiraceae bacterium]MBQ9836520.1 DUF3797 domain-containing protein [Oscillospiraceae bacterium]